jgi:3-oxoacyl-[acyl-carrier-protein] synthase II
MINSSFASGADAIGMAARRIRDGNLDSALAGGSEAPITPSIVAGFTSLGALSDGNDDPVRSIRPFDLHRRGCGLGEGAAFVLLEERELAIERGATILTEVIGYGSSMDAFHITQLPDNGDGLRRAMHLALDDAGIEPVAVDYLNAHGTGTDMNDRIETLVIRDVFGANDLPVSSTKAVTGHLLGAAGALEAVITILAMGANIAPPTINWSTRDPECDLDYIPNDARQLDITIAMTNSMGFGGHNASLIFAKGEG